MTYSSKSTVGSTRGVLWNLGLITLGSVLYAVAINGILIPQKFFGAGFAGVSLVIHYLVPSLPVAMLYFILNVPLYALGWMYVGRRFFLYSIAGVLIFSGVLACPTLLLPIHDKILSALLAGIITGVGSGIILRSLGSAGGLDILSIILLYVNSSMVNLVVTGLSQRKAAYIISPQWEEISREIMEKIQRGVTIIRGQGGYTGGEEQILYTVITFRELSRLKQMIRDIDPDAFVVVTDTLEVMGHRIGTQPHW